MSYKALILITSLIFVSCKFSSEIESKPKTVNRDSVLFYHSISIDSKRTLKDRIRAIDRALNFVNTNDSLFSKVVYQKSFLHYSTKQYDSLLYYSKLLAKSGNQTRDAYYLGKQYHLQAYCYDEVLSLPDSAFYYYNLSKGHFQNLQDSSQVGKRLIAMGQIQQNQNDFFGSKETITEALQYFNSKKDVKSISSLYSTLATNHRKLLNYQDAIKYYSEAIKITNSQKDKLVYQNNLATAYRDNKQYNEAILLLQNVVLDSLNIKNKKEYARVLDNLAYTRWLSGKKTNPKAFLEPLKIRQHNNDKRGQISSYTHLGEFYSKTNFKKAEAYFDSVLSLSKTIKMPRAEIDVLKFLMRLQPQNVKIRDRHIFLQDSLSNQELNVKTQFAKYKYDYRVKQEEILRLEKENTEKELEASQQRNQKILSLGGFLFITSVLGLSLYSFRQRTKRLKQKSKAEKLAAIHETEAELSRKLHDDHGGKLNQAMLMVQRDTDKSAILDKLESVYNQIRNFSRDINAVDTGPNFWKGLKATLEYTKPTEVDMVLNGGKELDWSLVGHQTKTILFKVLQELVINMARHSRANQTVILFKDLNKELFIYYEDDGVGASEDSLLRKNGLRNTEKRIKAIGGSIIFDSEEGKGFRTEIRIPK